MCTLIKELCLLRKLLDKVAKESDNTGLTINCKEADCIVLSERDSTRWRLQMGVVTINQVEKFNCLKRVLADKCDTKLKNLPKAKQSI